MLPVKLTACQRAVLRSACRFFPRAKRLTDLRTVRLRPGDLLFIFTDGVVEAENDHGEEFGESRLFPCIRSIPLESAADTLRRVMTEVNSFAGYVRQHDDITCFILRVAG